MSQEQQLSSWPSTRTIHLGEDCNPEIPLMDIGDGFRIYSFDMTGQTRWNTVAAASLAEKLKPFDFEGIVTVQTKSCGLAQALSQQLGHEAYLEVRKSRKPFMDHPLGVSVNSITTDHRQELWIGREKYLPFVGKKLCFLDDVVSTGGTIGAMLKLAEEIGLTITVVACVLTEGTNWTSYNGLPIVSLDHIPLPAKSASPVAVG